MSLVSHLGSISSDNDTQTRNMKLSRYIFEVQCCLALQEDPVLLFDRWLMSEEAVPFLLASFPVLCRRYKSLAESFERH